MIIDSQPNMYSLEIFKEIVGELLDKNWVFYFHSQEPLMAATSLRKQPPRSQKLSLNSNVSELTGKVSINYE